MTKSVNILALLAITCIMLGCTPRVAQVSEYANRSFDPRGLITVNDLQIQACLKAILINEDDVRTDFRRIQDWVASNIIYDAVVKEYWQLPADTIRLKKGDCKDYSTLLCTLWRAWGIPAADVYVAIGRSLDNKHHAFLIERHLKGKWQVIEPQVGGFISSDLSAAETAEKYAISFLFNDVSYINQPTNIYQLVRGNGVKVTYSKPPVVQQLPVINSFTSDRLSVSAGGSAFLSWDVSGADYVAIDQGIGEVCSAGTAQVNPADSLEYKLVAMNGAGSVQASVSLKVVQAAYARPALPPAPGAAIKPEFIVGFAGWLKSGDSINTVNAGQPVMARMQVKGGSAGLYLIRIWRAINLGNDEIVAQAAFEHDGISSTGELTFAPSYYIGEAGTRGYWVDLMADSLQVWKMPNAYPPRLTVIPKRTAGALAVSFAGWYTGVDSVNTADIGQEVTGGLCLSAGTAGQYVLNVRRDTIGLSDEILKQLTFEYDGTSSLWLIKFSPQSASNESGTRGYYLDLYKDGVFLWSLSGSYPPRLTVMKTK